MTILFQGQGEREGVRYNWSISKGAFGTLTATVSAPEQNAGVAAILRREPQSSEEAERACEALVPDLLERGPK